MNDTANVTLALGASPIMSSSPDEAASLSKLIDGLLLNLGTITQAQTLVQRLAGEAANAGNKPIVFDPVGVGATPYRRQAASGTPYMHRVFKMLSSADIPLFPYVDLLSAVHMSIIKGNAGKARDHGPFWTCMFSQLTCRAGEIGSLAGSSEVASRGVDSVGTGFKDPATIVRELARRESKFHPTTSCEPALK